MRNEGELRELRLRAAEELLTAELIGKHSGPVDRHSGESRNNDIVYQFIHASVIAMNAEVPPEPSELSRLLETAHGTYGFVEIDTSNGPA